MQFDCSRTGEKVTGRMEQKITNTINANKEKGVLQKTGKAKETLAAEYLQQNGVTVIERNYRCRQGEIDLVGVHQEYLVFVEVKYRRTVCHGAPEEAVTDGKQKRICKAADHYRMMHHCSDAQPFRYDVVAVTGNGIVWHRHAFEHNSRGRM